MLWWNYKIQGAEYLWLAAVQDRMMPDFSRAVMELFAAAVGEDGENEDSGFELSTRVYHTQTFTDLIIEVQGNFCSFCALLIVQFVVIFNTQFGSHLTNAMAKRTSC